MSTSGAYEGTRFKSTQKWNDLIQYLYQHVDQKERKFKHKKFFCFTGMKAVGVLHEHVLKNHQRFNCSSSLPRENMLLLCQKFADQGLVVPAEHNNSSRVSFAFEDSSHTFYKFSDEACAICRPLSPSMENAVSRVKSDSEERKHKLEAGSKQPSLKPLSKLNGNPTKRLFSMRNSEKQKQQPNIGKPPIKQSSMRITKNFPERFSSFRRKTSRNVDSAAVLQQDENGKVALSQNDWLRIRRQCVRVKLLQMIDLQFIGNLVLSPPSKNETKDSFFASHRSNPQPKCENKDSTESELSINDELVRSMFKLATMFATSREIYEQYTEINENVTSAKKIQLFFWIRDGLKKVFKNSSMFYSHLKEPIDEILLMIAEKPSSDTAKTLQLVIMLLDDNRIDQVKKTINFLKHLKQDQTFQLSSKRSNFTVAMEELLPVIFPHCASLSGYKIRGERVESQQFATLRFVSVVELMVERERSLFEMPPDLAQNIDRQRQLVSRELAECGEVENAAASLSIDNHFAQKVSVAEYERQKENFTQIQLQQLFNKLSSNKQLSHLTTARRDEIVREMRKVHTDIATTSKGSPHVNKKRSVSSLTSEHPAQAASGKRERLV